MESRLLVGARVAGRGFCVAQKRLSPSIFPRPLCVNRLSFSRSCSTSTSHTHHGNSTQQQTTPLATTANHNSSTLSPFKSKFSFDVTLDDGAIVLLNGMKATEFQLARALENLPDQGQSLPIDSNGHTIQIFNLGEALAINVDEVWTETVKLQDPDIDILPHTAQNPRRIVVRFGVRHMNIAGQRFRYPKQTGKPQDKQLQLAWQIMAATKRGDMYGAMEVFEQSIATGTHLKHPSISSLLYLIAGAKDWEDDVRGAQTQSRESLSPDLQKRLEFGEKVEQYAVAHSMMPDLGESGVSALARLATLRGDLDRALELANSPDSNPHARRYVPILTACAARKDLTRALEVEKLMHNSQLTLTEKEYSLILEAGSNDLPYNQVKRMLTKLGELATPLSHDIGKQIRTYFSSSKAAEVLSSNESWVSSFTSVDGVGHCGVCGACLQRMSLTDAHLNSLADAIHQYALKQRSKREWLRFVRFIDEHGPFQIILDGANIALLNQNYKGGTFRFEQVVSALDAAMLKFPNRRPLVVFHCSRTRDNPEAAVIFDRLSHEHGVFVTHCNDDMLWLYAALRAGQSGFLLSNDEMGDHIAYFGEPSLHRFKRDHQVRFDFVDGKCVLHVPPPYTTCVQYLESSKSWMVPLVGNEWLCIRRCQNDNNGSK